MRDFLSVLWKWIKRALMLIGALVVVHATILVVYNSLKEPPEPPGGWYPPQPGDRNYKEPAE